MNTTLKEIGKYVLNVRQSCYVAVGRATGLIDFPVPPKSSMRKTGSRSIRHFYTSGLGTYLPIATMALHLGVKLREKINVLDFGCGVGRQLLHFTRNFSAPTYFACDVDHSSVAFVARNYPSVVARTNKFDPPLPFDDESMDMVYSVSTFSHINPQDQKGWLRAVNRVTRPGGICLLTTEGWQAFGMRLRKKLPPEFGEELEANGIIYKEYEYYQAMKKHKPLSPVLTPLIGIDKSYGSTVMTPAFIREHWSQEGFEVVSIVEGIAAGWQDLVVLRKGS